MDIYKFIESKDIQEHCRKLGHQFNTVESAYLVWQSRFIPLTEKYVAWREIIDTMPDMQWNHKGKDWGSIHRCLERYIELEDRLVEDFYKTDEMYRFEEGWPSSTEKKFESVEQLIEARKSRIIKPDSIYTRMDKISQNINGSTFEICKRKRRSQGPNIAEARFNKDSFELLSVAGRYDALNEEEWQFAMIFKEMWVYVPTPFKPGDIVVSPDGPAVVHDWKLAPENREYIRQMEQEGAGRDMGISVLCMDRFGTNKFDYGVRCSQLFYPRLEYFRQELSPEHSFIKALSSYCAGELDLPKLLSAYYLYKEEMNLRALRSDMDGFSQEDRERMGIGSLGWDKD